MQRRIAVCINENIRTPVLLRAAQRKARDLRMPWVALYVETPGYYALSSEARDRLLRFMTMAEQMGGEVVDLPHKSAVAGVVEYIISTQASDAPIFHVIAGRSARDGILARLRPSFAQRLSAKLQRNWEVHIIPLTEDQSYVRQLGRSSHWRNLRLLEAGAVVCAVGGTTLASQLLNTSSAPDALTLNFTSVSLVFLTICTLMALRFGFFPGVLAGLLSLLSVNYFYVSPENTLQVNSVDDYVALLAFLSATLVISAVGGSTRAQVETALRRERRTQALFQINRLTANAQTSEEALEILHRALSEMLELDVVFFLPPTLNPDAIEPAYPKDMDLSQETRKALEEAWREKKPTGTGTPDRYHTTWRFEPMVTHNGEVGVMGINMPRDATVDAAFGRLSGALADHVAAIIERVELARSVEDTKIRQERERLRSMLLSSVSHDLKTPLASIIGSLSVYHSMRAKLPPERLEQLTQTALEEAQRLDSFITNILDMTRLESGSITYKMEWADPGELLLRVRKRMKTRLRGHAIHIHAPSEILEFEADVMMTEQVLENVLDNAIKYSPAGSDIDVSYGVASDGLFIEVRDRGQGIPLDKKDLVFDKYFRLKMEDSRVAGTGLGLAISRSIMESQKGTIEVENHPEGGAVFRLLFPSIRRLDAAYGVRAS
jgi:two-component system sensor histidine kinase KdpD